MKLSFQKINPTQDFEIKFNNLIFSGKLKRKDQKIISCEALLQGVLEHFCDKCGKEIELKLNEEINLIFSDGICENSSNSLDLIEFLDGEIDLEFVLHSEIEAYKSAYFYCDLCSVS